MSSRTIGEVGQLFEQRIHLRQGGRLDGEALAAEAQHLLVHRAQRLVGAGRQVVQGFLDSRDVVDVLEACDRNGDGSRHLCSPTFRFSSRYFTRAKASMMRSAQQILRLADTGEECQHD